MLVRRTCITALVHGDLPPAHVLSGPGDRMVAVGPRPTWADPDFDAVDRERGEVTDLTTLEKRAALDAVPRMCAGQNGAATQFLVTLSSS